MQLKVECSWKLEVENSIMPLAELLGEQNCLTSTFRQAILFNAAIKNFQLRVCRREFF